MLHAVYAVEKFLNDMHRRGCNFDIIFFKEAAQLCTSHYLSSSKHAYKYALAREIIIRHLSRSVPEISNGVKPQVLEFDSLSDPGLQAYFEKHAVHFILCHEGDERRGLDTVALQSIILQIISRGINVAIINSVQFQSSKVNRSPFAC